MSSWMPQRGPDPERRMSEAILKRPHARVFRAPLANTIASLALRDWWEDGEGGMSRGVRYSIEDSSGRVPRTCSVLR